MLLPCIACYCGLLLLGVAPLLLVLIFMLAILLLLPLWLGLPLGLRSHY